MPNEPTGYHGEVFRDRNILIAVDAGSLYVRLGIAIGEGAHFQLLLYREEASELGRHLRNCA